MLALRCQTAYLRGTGPLFRSSKDLLFRRLGLVLVGLGSGLGLVHLGLVGLVLRITPSEYQTFEIVDLWNSGRQSS